MSHTSHDARHFNTYPTTAGHLRSSPTNDGHHNYHPPTPRYVDVGKSEDVQSAMAAAAEDVNHSLARLEEFHGVVKQISGETDSFLRECVPALQVTCTAPAHPPSHKPTQRLTGGRVAAHPWPT